jgi:hypothetical protein
MRRQAFSPALEFWSQNGLLPIPSGEVGGRRRTQIETHRSATVCCGGSLSIGADRPVIDVASL